MDTENKNGIHTASACSADYSFRGADRSAADSTDRRGTLLSLTRMVQDLNTLAHDLEGSPYQERLFGLKHECCSVLLAAGVAIVNGTRGNLFGLDLVLAPGKKVHCPEWGLSPEARSVARHQARSVRSVAPLADRLSSVEFQSLQNVRASARRHAV
jgi:hypothetical protein